MLQMSEVLDPRIAHVLQNLRDRQSHQQNLCKVGRKIVTERQRRILCGLDVTNRSLDTTTASQNDNTLEDSWLDNSSKKRLELIRQRRSLTRRIGKSMGGYLNQFTMKVPPFDPRIEINASCSEDSADEETPQENVGGSQGRKGEGCSTPHHGNNTLAALRDIEISAVGFNSTDPEKILPIVGNNTVEMIDVESREQSLEIIEFKQPEIVPSASNGQPEQEKQGGTFIVEEKEMETTGGTGGTYTIRKETPEKKPPVIYHPSPQIKPTLLKDGRKSINKRQSVQFATDVVSPASRSFGFSASKFAKHSRILIDTPKFYRKNDDSAENIEETMRSIKISEKTIEFSDPSMIDAESDPRNMSCHQETPKRGGGSRLSRRSFVVEDEKPPVSMRYTEEKPQIMRKEEKPPITMAKSPGPRYSQPTISFLAKSPRISNGNFCRHYMSNYAGGDDYSGDDSSSIVEIEPTMKTSDELLKSGYQPRRHISKLQLQQKMKEFNADFDDNQANKTRMEERRKDFMERRLNNTKATATMTTPNRSMAPQSVDRKPVIRPEASIGEMADVSQPTATALVLEGAPLGDLGLTTIGDPSRQEQSHMTRRSEFTRRFSQLGDIDEGGDPYENDGVDTTAEEGIVIRQKGQPDYSIFSANVPSPAIVHHKKGKKHRQVDDSVVEDYIDHTREMILKPRKLIHPETPTDGLRRSKRTRMPPVRTWMGEQAVYESSPGGSKYLVGSNKVVVRDPRYVKAKTTDPVKALERERGFR